MIYKLLITRDEPIELVAYAPNSRWGDNRTRVAQRSFKIRPKLEKDGWDNDTRKFVQHPTDSMSLLLVNRQMMEEVVEVLYGNNVFEFDSVKAIRFFEKLCGHALRHVRTIRLAFDPLSQGGPQNDLKGAQQALWQATSLRQVSVHHNTVCKRPIGAEAMVGMFTPLLKKLQSYKAIEGINTSVEDVLHFEKCCCEWCVCHRRTSKAPVYYTSLSRCQYPPGCLDWEATLHEAVKGIVAKRFRAKA